MWRQHGAYPIKIAGWLESYLQSLASVGISFTSNNTPQGEETISKTFEDLNLNKFETSPQTTLRLPDLGYNYDRETDIANEEVDFVFAPRKADPDMTLDFYDNGMGLDKGWMTGFTIEMFLSDIIEGVPLPATSPGVTGETTYVNRPDDNVRLRIFEKVNTAVIPDSFAAYKSDDEDDSGEEDEIISNVMTFEFLTVDDTLSQLFKEFNITQPEGTSPSPVFKHAYYASFLKTFEQEQDYMPQVILLKNILNENGGSFSSDTIKSTVDEVMSTVTTTFVTAISENSSFFHVRC